MDGIIEGEHCCDKLCPIRTKDYWKLLLENFTQISCDDILL